MSENDIPLAHNKKEGRVRKFMVYGVNLNVTNPLGVKTMNMNESILCA
jgi:hypothetical protein